MREDKEEEGCSDIKESTWGKGEGRLRSAWEKGEGGWLVRKKWESRKWRKSLQWRWWRKKSEIDHSSNKDDLVLCFDIELKVKTTEKSQMKSDWYLIQTNMTSWPKANPGAQSFKLKVPTRIQRYATQMLKEKLQMLQWFELLGLECHNKFCDKLTSWDADWFKLVCPRFGCTYSYFDCRLVCNNKLWRFVGQADKLRCELVQTGFQLNARFGCS